MSDFWSDCKKRERNPMPAYPFIKGNPLAPLDEYRGKAFSGEWPTVVEMFELSCKRFPGNACFTSIFPEREHYTYAEVQEKVRKVSNYLVKRCGIRKGDKIAVSGKNSPQWAIAYLAILKSGAIVVPLDFGLHDNDMERLLKFAEATYLFIDRDRIRNIDADGSVGLKGKFSLEQGDPDYAYLFDLVEEEDVPRYHANEYDTAAILFTSGTTGTPKGVMLSHRNITSDTFLVTYYMPLYESDVFYVILPIHHAYTMTAVLMEALSVGASAVFGKRLAVTQMLKELKEGKVTMLLAVPMLYNKMIKALMEGIRKKGIVVYAVVRGLMTFSGAFKKLTGINIGKHLFKGILAQVSMDTNRICICGAGPLPESTYRLWNQMGIDFVEGYGLTEASPITNLNPPWHYKYDAVGTIFPQEEIKIVNPDENGNGVMYIKGPNVMQGYYKNPEATKEVLTEDGWLNTGDVGHLDANNFFTITGRERSIIVTEGGKNVFPEEIEDKFQLFDEIGIIAIIGYTVDKALKTEGVRAVIYPEPKYTEKMQKEHPDDYQGLIQKRMEALVEDVNKELHSYQKITRVTVTYKPLPLTTTAKVKRFEIKELFAD